MITIDYFAHDRPTYYWDITSYYFNKISEENKKKIKINVLATHPHNWQDYIDGIEIEVTNFPQDNNYLQKVSYALDTESKYSIKLDEDCFINNHIWDYLIENIDFLNSDDAFLISPLLSNNIPLVDIFIDKFVEEKEIKNKIYSEFTNPQMPNGLWGVDYTPVRFSNWNIEEFYSNVSNLSSPLKGIHPIRICANAQIYLNDYILNNFNKINSKQDYSFIDFIRPYFTINTFAIKTDDWKRALELRSYDSFDEIQINNYCKMNNKICYYINNSFSIHTLYNTMYGNKNIWDIGIEDGQEYEQNFVKSILEKLK
jgi:hypothetical protein